LTKVIADLHPARQLAQHNFQVCDQSGMTALVATVKEQASQIQKVSAQLETSKSAPQVVNNP
jgi:hypothetical protein